MNQVTHTYTQPGSALSQNKVIQKTYLLLSFTLLLGAATAYFAMITNARPMGLFTIVIYFGLFFATTALRNSRWGILCVCALTAFLGYSLGPILNMYLHAYVNGAQLIGMALGATGVIFLGLSGYAFATRKDFSYMGGFISVTIMIAFLASLAAIFFHLPTLSLLVSGAFALISSAYILYITSQLINGGETNYIMATLTLFVSIFNIFISLLNILGAFGGSRR
jgi:modulator of FtsH protease